MEGAEEELIYWVVGTQKENCIIYITKTLKFDLLYYCIKKVVFKDYVCLQFNYCVGLVEFQN